MLKAQSVNENLTGPDEYTNSNFYGNKGEARKNFVTSGHVPKVLVGREREMDDLNQALKESMEGHGQIVMLAGEAGIGKTRVAEEFAAQAEREGALTLSGRCYDKPGVPSWWPWAQAIRPYVLQSDPKTLALEMGLGAADIARIIPEVQQKMPDIDLAPELEPDQARFRIFDSITSFLKALAAKQPLVIVLDDLQHADISSALLLQFMAPEIRNNPILLIGCYREAELSPDKPLTEVLGSLYQERSFRQVHLQNLSWRSVMALIENEARHTVPQWVVESVHRLTGGNPFFVQEVVRMLSQEGKLAPEVLDDSEGWSIEIPGSVREVILNRVSSLSPDCRDVLEIASVVGGEFSFVTLSKMFVNLGPEGLLEALEEARDANLIYEVSDKAGYYQFTHAIIQRTIFEGNSPMRRALTHSQVAGALEELYLNNAEVGVAELVHHFGKATTVVGVDKFVEYSIIAGEEALDAYTPEDALAYFQQALDARERQPLNDEIARILFGLGRTQAAMGQIFKAWLSFKRAFDYYIDNDNVPRAVDIAEYPIVIIPGDTERVRLISTVLDKVAADSLDAGRLLATYGRVLYLATGEYGKARESLERALAIAQREGRSSLETRIKAYMATVEIDHMRWEDGIAQCRQAIDRALHINDLKVEVRARYDWARAMFTTGNLNVARSIASEASAQAEKQRDSFWLASSYWMNSTLARLAGKPEIVRPLIDRGLSLQPSDARLLGTRALMEYEHGNAESGRPYLDELLKTMNLATGGPIWENAVPALIVPLIAYIQDDADLLEAGSRAVQSAANKVISAQSATPELYLWANAGLAIMASMQDDKELAQKCVSTLQDAKRASTRLVAGIIHVDRVLAMIAKTLGLFDQAESYIRSAMQYYRDENCHTELAWTCFEYASLMAANQQRLNRSRFNVVLGESLDLANRFGMGSLIQRIAELKDENSRGRARLPYDLTPREGEVLVQIVHGKSNNDIAELLNIEPNTVIRHVSNIFSKLDSHNRAEAAAIAVSRGIVEYNPPQ